MAVAPPRIPFSLFWNVLLLMVRVPHSYRIPAPLRSGTSESEKIIFSIYRFEVLLTIMAFRFGIGVTFLSSAPDPSPMIARFLPVITE